MTPVWPQPQSRRPRSPWRRAALAAALVVLVAVLGMATDWGRDFTDQVTASCYVAGDSDVNVTFSNPTGQAVTPAWVSVVTFDQAGDEDWSDTGWAPAGYLLGGYVVAAGQAVTFEGDDAAYAPYGAYSCQVINWRAN